MSSLSCKIVQCCSDCLRQVILNGTMNGRGSLVVQYFFKVELVISTFSMVNHPLLLIQEFILSNVFQLMTINCTGAVWSGNLRGR